jgi:hypothetical protein
MQTNVEHRDRPDEMCEVQHIGLMQEELQLFSACLLEAKKGRWGSKESQILTRIHSMKVFKIHHP